MLNAYETATGERKNAVGNGHCVKRANFVWLDQALKPLPASAAVTGSRKTGDFLRGHCAPSKCDRSNTEWGGKPQWFRLDSSNPLNFAFRWQQHELAYPCPEGLRSSWPAFSPSGDDIPYSSASLSAECSRLFAASLGAADADGRTFHSWRARLASALGAARAAGDRSIDDSVIQALAHWKTVASVHRYIRMRPEDYARFVDIASSTDAGMQVRTDLPDIDPGRAMAEVMQASGLIERGLGGPVGATAVARPGPDRAARNPDPPVPRARRAGVRQDAASSSASHPDLPVPRARRAAAWQDTASSSTGNPAEQPARPTEEAPAARFDLGDGSIGVDAGSDPLGLVGTSWRVPNKLWDAHDAGSTMCSVRAFIGQHKFAKSSARKTAYVIADETTGFLYPVTADFLNAVANSAAHRRKGKQQRMD